MKKILLLTLSIFVLYNINAQTNFYRDDAVLVKTINGDTLKNPWAGGFNSVQFSKIDIDLDGTKDLFVFDRTGNRISTFIHSGDVNSVNYKHEPQYTDLFPPLHDWVLLRDYNCDGKMDIYTYSSGGMAVYKNTSTTNLSFELQTNLLLSNHLPNFVNIYVSSSDIPAIDDIDGDGDLDILTFSIFGTYVDYHKNLSIETYGTCDSLSYELKNECWGYFSENLISNSVTVFDTCTQNVPNPERTSNITSVSEYLNYSKNSGGNKHAGSTLFTLDVDANNSKDLVLGDVSFNNFTLLYNNDVSTNLTASSINNQDNQFPLNHTSSTATNIEIFPAGFYIDVNNDNVKDLIASPNCFNGCENSNSVWYYKNNNATNSPVFTLEKNNFLQEGMIEIGEGAHPVFYDYNADGLQDFIIGNYGVFNSSLATNYSSSLQLYQNIGTTNNPEFQLINNDLVHLSAMNLDLNGNQPTLGLHPTFGDLDGDGDFDMIVGDYIGKLHYFNNVAGAGNPSSFTLNQAQYQGIDIGNNAAPLLIDLNRDNKLDLVIGTNTGYFTYYENTGTTTAPTFTHITDSLGYVNTKSYYNFMGASVPYIYDDAGSYKMLSGSKEGTIYHFENIDGNLTGTFTVLDTNYLNIYEGINSSISCSDINNDGELEMLVGNYSGGVAYYSSNNTSSMLDQENQLSKITLYPNPTTNNLTINLGNNNVKNSSIEVIDLLGKTMLKQVLHSKKSIISLSSLPQGVYLVKFRNELGSKVYKVVKN